MLPTNCIRLYPENILAQDSGRGRNGSFDRRVHQAPTRHLKFVVEGPRQRNSATVDVGTPLRPHEVDNPAEAVVTRTFSFSVGMERGRSTGSSAFRRLPRLLQHWARRKKRFFVTMAVAGGTLSISIWSHTRNSASGTTRRYWTVAERWRCRCVSARSGAPSCSAATASITRRWG